MWPLRSVNTTPGSSRSRAFSCSSFKDIQSLCKEDPGPASGLASPRSPSLLHRVRISAWANRSPSSPHSPSHPPVKLPDETKSIVIYSTSLRVVRKTFEDCRAVRSILCGLRVPLDERDLSMDARFVHELHQIMGRSNRKLSLPCVFIGGRYVGGAEEVKKLHESGDLRALVRGGSAPVGSTACGLCGRLRYVVCEQCSGSRKIYSDKLGLFKSCKACNVNGLTRCPSCSSSIL